MTYARDAAVTEVLNYLIMRMLNVATTSTVQQNSGVAAQARVEALVVHRRSNIGMQGRHRGTERKSLSPLWRCHSRRRRRRQNHRVPRVQGRQTPRTLRAPWARQILANPLHGAEREAFQLRGHPPEAASPALATTSRFQRAPARELGRITPTSGVHVARVRNQLQSPQLD